MLRAHGLIKKVPHTHRYLLTEYGRVAIAAISPRSGAQASRMVFCRRHTDRVLSALSCSALRLSGEGSRTAVYDTAWRKGRYLRMARAPINSATIASRLGMFSV